MANITTNIKDVLKGIKEVDEKQIPYATSVALNSTAEIAMKAMKHKIDKDFNITSTWNKVGGKYGIKKRKATKKRLDVEIFIPKTNTWLEDHEEGDERRNQLIPTKAFRKAYPSANTNRKMKKKATTLLSNKSKNRIFEASLTQGSSVKAIFQRVKGKTQGVRQKKSKKTGRLLRAKKIFNRDIIPIFIIKSTVKEKPILEFEATILKVVEKNIGKEFSKAFEYAMRTAR